jgi:hypothetical protein
MVFSRDPAIATRVEEAAGGDEVKSVREGGLPGLVAALIERRPAVLVVDGEGFERLHPVTALLELRRLQKDLPLIVLLNGRRPTALKSAHVTYLGRPPASDALRAALAPFLAPRVVGGRGQ